MGKSLASWLKEDYDITASGEVRPKNKMQYRLGTEVFDIPEDGIWIQTFCGKDQNKDLIIRCIPALTHPYCLTLAELHKETVKLNTAKRTFVRWPWENSDLHGYMYIVNEDGVFADGEVHAKTLNASMHPFAATMLVKRAEDRLILRALGLYQQGFYSKEEFGSSEGNGVSVDVEDIPSTTSTKFTQEEIEKIKIKNLKIEIKKLGDEKFQKDPLFDLETFAMTLTNKNSKTQPYDLKDYQMIYNALLN